MKNLLICTIILGLLGLGLSTNWKHCSSISIPEPPCCGEIDSSHVYENRIKGGKVTGIQEFPWMVFVYASRGRNGFLCGGSLINARWILTAAHCVHKELGLTIRLREWNLRTNPDCIGENCKPRVLKYRIDKYFIHESYNKIRIQNDIALLRLRKPIVLNRHLQPICLPLKKPRNLTGKTAVTAGWGKFRKYTLSNILQKASLAVWSIKKCGHYNENINTTVHLCAGGVKGVSICDGDSGGPLMLPMLSNKKKDKNSYQYLIGLTSLSYGYCGLEDSPSIFTNVFPYMQWIRNKINKYK